jgi:protein-L-isoaspartate(D-aspartate) O-methyltransferase
MEKNRFQEERSLMVKEQIKSRGFFDARLLEVFESVPRHLFVAAHDERWAYGDYPISIGHAQTISQPYIVALMIQKVSITENSKVLEIGTGSGYQTALLASLSKEVYTVERIKALQEGAKKILGELEYTNIKYLVADGHLGWSEFAPYDAIIVSAATKKIPPKLISQLSNHGKMIIPIGDCFEQDLMLVTKKKDNFDTKLICGCRFVPLIKNHKGTGE